MKPIPAGYSGTPLIIKLDIKPEMKILLIYQPNDYYEWLGTQISDQSVKSLNWQ